MRKAVGLVSVIAAVSYLAALYFFDPARNGFFVPCLFFVVTGRKCPGCGAQRSIHQLLHGNFKDAFLLCPFLYFVLLVLCVYFFFPKVAENRWFAGAVLLSTFVYAVLRISGMCGI